MEDSRRDDRANGQDGYSKELRRRTRLGIDARRLRCLLGGGEGFANEDKSPRYGELLQMEVVNEKGKNAEHDGRGEELAGSNQVKGEGWVERGLFGNFGSGCFVHDGLLLTNCGEVGALSPE